MHTELDDRLVAEVDSLAGPRGRSGFVRAAIEQAVRQERRWQDVEAAAGAIVDTGHVWATILPSGCGSSVGPTSDAPVDVLQVLDSTVLIDFLRGRPAVGDLPFFAGLAMFLPPPPSTSRKSSVVFVPPR